MRYALRIRALGKYPEVELNNDEYESLKKARMALFNGLALEEKYEILISNYLELEREILDRATQSMIRNPSDYDDFFQVRMSLNRRLVNLLTAVRLYADQLHRHVKGILSDKEDVKRHIDSLLSQEYDSSLEYRFMEALRNYVQHRGIPVHWVQFHSHAEAYGEDRLLIYSVEMASQKEYLQEDPKFKKSVLNEIPEKVDLKSSIRTYVEGISRIHCAARKLVEKDLGNARSLISNAIASYGKVFNKRPVGLHATCFEGNTSVETVPLLLDWDDIRIKLSKRNSELVNLRNRYVTGRSKTPNK